MFHIFNIQIALGCGSSLTGGLVRLIYMTVSALKCNSSVVVVSRSDGTVSQPADGGRVFIKSTTARISAAVSTRLLTSWWPKASGSTSRRQIHPAGVGVGGGLRLSGGVAGCGLWVVGCGL